MRNNKLKWYNEYHDTIKRSNINDKMNFIKSKISDYDFIKLKYNNDQFFFMLIVSDNKKNIDEIIDQIYYIGFRICSLEIGTIYTFIGFTEKR